jgi:cell division protein FtsX
VTLSRYVVAATLRAYRRGGASASVAVLLSALAVLAAGGTLAGDLALARAEATWRAGLRLIAVLRDASSSPQAPDGVVARARALFGVESVRYVAPDTALGELKRLLGPHGHGLERLPSNPLPPRLAVTPAAGLSAAELQALAEALDRLPGVSEVQTAHGWVEPVERLRRGLRLAGLALAGSLALAALGAAAGASRAARRAARDESSILRLAGVPARRLAAPFVLQACSLATLGALLGLALLLLASEPGAPWTGSWLRTPLGLDPLPLLPSRWLVGLGGAGAALGLVGALAASRS